MSRKESFLARSKKLTFEAKNILKILAYDKLLSDSNKWCVIGSTELSLVYKPDLDVRISTDENLLIYGNKLKRRLQKLTKSRILIRTIVPNKLVGVHVKKWTNSKTNTTWNLDFGICSPKFFKAEIQSFNKIKDLLKNAKRNQRELILKIKKESQGKKKYEWGYKIYLAVIKHSVKNTKEYFDLIDKSVL